MALWRAVRGTVKGDHLQWRKKGLGVRPGRSTQGSQSAADSRAWLAAILQRSEQAQSGPPGTTHPGGKKFLDSFFDVLRNHMRRPLPFPNELRIIHHPDVLWCNLRQRSVAMNAHLHETGLENHKAGPEATTDFLSAKHGDVN